MPLSESIHLAKNVSGDRWGAGIFKAGAAALAAALAYFAFRAEVRDPLHLPLGLAILALAALPSLLWARQGKASLPVFETLMLTTANAYALPLLNGHQELIFYAAEDVSQAAFAVLGFQLSALVTYRAVSGTPSTHPFWRDEIISGEMSRWLTYGMVLNTGYLLVSSFTSWVPAQLESILRAVFFGIGIVSTFIASRRLGSGELSAGEKIFFLTNLLLQCAAMMTSLFLVGTVSLLLLAFVGFISSSGKLPLIASGAALLGIAVLHNGKAEMREKYWRDGERLQPQLAETPAFFSEWIEHGLDFDADAEGKKVTAKLIDRTSLFHLMCLVVSVSPQQQAFLGGETYKDVPGQFVPRLLWPDKPPGHVSTSKLSVYYGLQREEDTAKTTIGFGMVTEGYANFGFLGVAGIGAFLGLLIKKLQCWGAESPLFSYGGLLSVLFLAWSFQTEFTLSIWLASLYQASLAVLVPPFLLRRVFG